MASLRSDPRVAVLFLADGVIHNRPRAPETRFRKGEVARLRPASADYWVIRGIATDDPAAIAAAEVHERPRPAIVPSSHSIGEKPDTPKPTP